MVGGRVHSRPRGHIHGSKPPDHVRHTRDLTGLAGEIERLNRTIGLRRTNILIAQRAPIAPALPKGRKTKAWTVAEYIAMWERKHGRRMVPDEKADLERGCIGITNLNLASGSLDPPLGMSFAAFAQASNVAKALNAILNSKPTLAKFDQMVKGDKLLSKLKRVVSSLPNGDPAQWRAVIFSKRFYSNQASDWDKRKKAKPGAFAPDPKTGQVDMSSYDYQGRPNPSAGAGAEYTNFDYGWYDEDTGNWWHANHAEPGMKVYQSTLEYYSRPLLDFDKQVFSVAFARR